AEIFFFPYNRKVWGYPLERLGVSWMGERVAVPDLERLRRNVRTGRDDVSWGPNNMFRFPRHGGTGAIWQGVAALLPAEKVLFGAEVVAVRLPERVVELRDGRRAASTGRSWPRSRRRRRSPCGQRRCATRRSRRCGATACWVVPRW